MDKSRIFIELPTFTRKWFALGLNDEDLRLLQNKILEDPENAGVKIPGTGGIQKIRVAAKGHGKRGGARVIYVDIKVKAHVHLLNVYAKNEKDDLTEKEKEILRKLVEILGEEDENGK